MSAAHFVRGTGLINAPARGTEREREREPDGASPNTKAEANPRGETAGVIVTSLLGEFNWKAYGGEIYLVQFFPRHIQRYHFEDASFD